MQIEVMSKHRIEDYAMQEHNETSILISIVSHGEHDALVIPNKINNIQNVLFLHFNDTDKRDKYSGGIESSDAVKIRKFIQANSDFNKIIVNCEAGQSRSAGVAAALMKYYNNDDTPIFNCTRYTPNMLCYRTVLEEFMTSTGD